MRTAFTGPDLATVAAKPREQLIEAIVDPNRAVEQRYRGMTFALDEGTAASGLIVVDTPGSVTIRLAGGEERVIRRSRIEESYPLATSPITDCDDRPIHPRRPAHASRPQPTRDE